MELIEDLKSKYEQWMEAAKAEKTLREAFYTAINQEALKHAKFKVGTKLYNSVLGTRLLVESINGVITSDGKFKIEYKGTKLTKNGKTDNRGYPNIKRVLYEHEGNKVIE